jgi:hypothetical protein
MTIQKNLSFHLFWSKSSYWSLTGKIIEICGMFDFNSQMSNSSKQSMLTFCNLVYSIGLFNFVKNFPEPWKKEIANWQKKFEIFIEVLTRYSTIKLIHIYTEILCFLDLFIE